MFFIWGNRVAGVNPYKIYDSMYNEEMAHHSNQRNRLGGGMPKKWLHLKFMAKLVYDLISPG